MRKLKVTFILPDDVGEGWRNRIPSTLDHFPDLQEKICLCNDDATKMHEFTVTGISSWQEKRWFREIEKIEVYLDNAPMPLDFVHKS